MAKEPEEVACMLKEKSFSVPVFIFNAVISILLTINCGVLGYIISHLDRLEVRVAEHISLPSHPGTAISLTALEKSVEVSRLENAAAHLRIESWLRDKPKTP